MGDHSQEGGDPACWLDHVCAECGSVMERPDEAACEYCGAVADNPPTPVAAGRRRDRDEEGRARNARPRDGLGRPLPYGVDGVERQPEGVVRTPEQTIAEAQKLLDTGMPFHAHEVFEDAWKAADETRQALWRGLAQLAVGLTHAARGNAKGARSLLLRGAANIRPFAAQEPFGLDIDGLDRWASLLAEGADTGKNPPAADDIAPVLLR